MLGAGANGPNSGALMILNHYCIIVDPSLPRPMTTDFSPWLVDDASGIIEIKQEESEFIAN